MAKEVKQWITIKGRHIPIMEGESKADVIKRLKEGAKKGKESRPKTEEAKKKDVRKKENEWKEASRDHAKKFDSNWNDPTPRKKANLEKAGKKLGETAHAYGEAIKQKAIKSAKFNKKESSAGNKEISVQSLKQNKGLGEHNGYKIEIGRNEDGSFGKRTAVTDAKGNTKFYNSPEKAIEAVKKGISSKDKTPKVSHEHQIYENGLKAKENDAISRTASRLQKKGFNDPESIEKHLRELSPVRRNRLAQELGVTGRGDEKIKAMVDKIHGSQQNNPLEQYRQAISNSTTAVSKYHENPTPENKATALKAIDERISAQKKLESWQDKDAEVKAKQIANADKQKAERNNAAKSPYRSTKKSKDRLLNPINEHEYRVSNNEDVKAAIQDASKRIFDNEELTGHAMQMKYDNMEGFYYRGSAVVTRRKNQWNLSPDDTGGAGKALMQAHYEVTGETKKPGNKFNYKDRETARKVFEKSSYIMSKLEEESVPEKKAPAKFNAKESMNSINELSKKRNNGGKTEDDWKSVRDTLDKAPAGTVMISNGERGSQSHYKKLKDGSWESMSGYNKGEIKTSKLISMGWEGHTGSSPQVEFTTEKKMAAAKAKAQASVDKAFKKAADIPGIKSNKSTLTRSGSSMYLDLDRADITEANIKALTKKGWIRRGHMDDTWIYSAKSRK